VALFLGIDGGGSKTRCIIGDETQLLGTGTSSGSNLLRVGEACTRDSFSAAIHECCVQAGVSPQSISRTCAGVAGAAQAEVREALERLLGEIVGGEIEVVGDMETALEAAFGVGPGVIVIAGTGSIAYGRNRQGETVRAGGWGRMISDEGSGHWIGVEAIGYALRAHARGGHSLLLRGLMAALDSKTVDDLIVRANASPAPDFASLFPVILEAAKNGDPNARAVLRRAGGELARLAEVAIERLFRNEQEVEVAALGGVFTSSAEVQHEFTKQLNAISPKARVVMKTVDPALGAFERARRGFAARAQRSL
jgi:glucosamine kinase